MLPLLRQQWLIFCAALTSFTRLPITSTQLNAQHFTQAAHYLPLVGLGLGLWCAGIYQLASLFFLPLSATILALIAGMLATGALHEDGFADCCDGLGGGCDVAQIGRAHV